MTPDPSPALLAIADYAESVLTATAGAWPPLLRESTCREALRNIVDECRRESATTPTEEQS